MLAKRTSAAAAALGLLLLAIGLGCGQDELAQGPGVLDGRAYLRGSSDHSGIKVSISGWSAGPHDTCGCVFPDSSGYYRFEGVPDGTWSLEFGCSYYYEVREKAVIKNGYTIDPPPDVYLTKVLSGKAYLHGQDDHSGICAEVSNGHGMGVGPDGSYVLPLLPDGEYTLSFSFPYYDTQERAITITDGLADPPLGETTLTTSSFPVIVRVSDYSHPEYNPEGAEPEVTASVLDESGAEVWRGQWDQCLPGDDYECGCGFFLIPDLPAGAPHDIVLTVPRYFVLEYFDVGASTDSLVIENVAREEGRGARTPDVVVYSYHPNEINVIFMPDVQRAEVDSIVAELDCSIDLVSWNFYHKVYEYRLNTPDYRTEWETIDLFVATGRVIYAGVRAVNKYEDR